jgi:hypothetical protein
VLARFCARHSTKGEQFEYGRDSGSKIYCPDCRGSRIVGDGVFLLHVGCEAINPFWDKDPNANQVGAVPETGQFEENNRAFHVDHWELQMLREAAGPFRGLKEMWFPQALFITLNGEDQKSRSGTLIKLAGAGGVGKTTLSTMTFSPASYGLRSAVSRNARPAVRFSGIEHFVYVGPQPGDPLDIQFLRGLYPGSLLHQGRWEPGAILPTPRFARPNLRAAFLRLPTGDGGLTTALKVILGRSSPRQHTVAFYDSGGETHRLPAPPWLRAMDYVVDVVAVVIAADHIGKFITTHEAAPGTAGSGQPVADSIPVAVDGINRVASNRPRRCVVVTRLDVIESRLDARAQAHLKNIRDNKHTARSLERNLLKEWLRGGSAKESELADLLGGDDVDRVFFAWAEGLEKAGEVPRGVGLRKLILWARDVSRGQKPSRE